MRAWDTNRKVEARRESNERLVKRNDALAADVRDLKQGLDAIEERARQELGMIRGDEVFLLLLLVDAPPKQKSPISVYEFEAAALRLGGRYPPARPVSS